MGNACLQVVVRGNYHHPDNFQQGFFKGSNAFCSTPHRFLSMGYGIHVAMDSASVDDIVYCPLPLYHSAGGVIGLGACFFFGATLVVRRKFSASRFWPECVQHRVTVRN